VFVGSKGSKSSVTIWLDRLKAGDAEATERIWNRYFLQVVRLAKWKLRGLPRGAADEEDVAIAAFNSFYRAVAKQDLPRMANRADLWRLLFAVTTRKAIDQRRRQDAARRGGTANARERPVLPVADAMLEDLLSREPDPGFATLVKDEFNRLLAQLPDDDLQLRQIVVLKLEGHTNAEVGRCCGCSMRTVERRLWLIRQTWEQAGAR
jgi:DNA-directed RNA polymerase specialized sigma24 family protein